MLILIALVLLRSAAYAAPLEECERYCHQCKTMRTHLKTPSRRWICAQCGTEN